jgi:tetratricopeptide (TPR) repeat protein
MERAGLLSRANRYATEGRWSEAVDIYSHILEQGTRFQQVLRSRANALTELGRWGEALRDFEELLASNPRKVRLWYEMALAQLASGDEKAYRKTCERMIDRFRETRDPITAEFVSWTSCLSRQLKRNWVDELALAAELYDDGESSTKGHRTLGAALLRAGLYEESIAILENSGKAVAQDHSKISADYNLYLRAIAHAQLGEMSKAREYLDRTQPFNDVISTSGEAGAPWFRRATLAVLRHECEQLLNGSADNNHGTQNSDRESRLARGLRYLSEAIELKPEIPMLYEVRAGVHRRLGQTRQVEADLARADRLQKTGRLRRINRLVDSGRLGRRFLRLERARYLFEEAHDYDRALEDCHVVLEGDNMLSPEALELLFEIHKARGTLDVCDKHWPVKLGSPPPSEFFLARSRFYGQQGEDAKAIADLEQARKLAQSIFSMRETAKHFRDQGLREISVKLLTAALATDPNSSELYNDRAWDYMELGEYEKALADCDAAIRLDPKSTRALADRAWANNSLGRFPDAISDCNQAIEIDPNHYFAFQRRAWAHREIGELDLAAADAKRAIEIDPSIPFAAGELKKVVAEYVESEQWEKAIDCYDRLIEVETQNVFHHKKRATCELISQGLEIYRKRCQQAIERFATPVSEATHKRVIVAMCVEVDGAVDDTTAIVELAKEVVAAELPNPVSSKKLLATALLRNGQADKALPLLLEVESNNSEKVKGQTLFRLAMAYHALGQSDRARDYLRSADAWLSDYLTGDSQSGTRPARLRRLQQEAHDLLGVSVPIDSESPPAETKNRPVALGTK